jgi:hypothetical protein
MRAAFGLWPLVCVLLGVFPLALMSTDGLLCRLMLMAHPISPCC